MIAEYSSYQSGEHCLSVHVNVYKTRLFDYSPMRVLLMTYPMEYFCPITSYRSKNAFTLMFIMYSVEGCLLPSIITQFSCRQDRTCWFITYSSPANQKAVVAMVDMDIFRIITIIIIIACVYLCFVAFLPVFEQTKQVFAQKTGELV